MRWEAAELNTSVEGPYWVRTFVPVWFAWWRRGEVDGRILNECVLCSSYQEAFLCVDYIVRLFSHIKVNLQLVALSMLKSLSQIIFWGKVQSTTLLIFFLFFFLLISLIFQIFIIKFQKSDYSTKKKHDYVVILILKWFMKWIPVL